MYDLKKHKNTYHCIPCYEKSWAIIKKHAPDSTEKQLEIIKIFADYKYNPKNFPPNNSLGELNAYH